MSARRLALAIAAPVLCIVSCTETRGKETEASLVAAEESAPYLAIFSAFPAEMAPLLAQATVDSTKVINDRTFYLGTLRGVRVAMGITGIGLGNAKATAHAVLAELPVTGVVFSGVAGGPLRIGDVAVPATWSLATGGSFAVDPAWLSLASSLVAPGSPCFEQCTIVQWTREHVCLAHVPGVAVGGEGQSKEADSGVVCDQNGGDVFGCEVGTPEGQAESCQAGGPTAPPSPDAGTSTIVDNETAAVAAEAAERGLRFIAFRSLSDGAGDPLGLPGFPGQFFAYYRLAARNAASTTLAFVERVATVTSSRRLP
jgi:nucleoside phosphorylase